MGLKTKLIFDEELNSYYESVKAEFEDFLKIEIAKESKEMAPLIEKGVLGGKMLRPVLCRLVSDALDGDAHLAFECGMALELVHGGALIHDDWIDGDSFRRAAPALWEELGPRSAILIADLMVATGSLHEPSQWQPENPLPNVYEICPKELSLTLQINKTTANLYTFIE